MTSSTSLTARAYVPRSIRCACFAGPGCREAAAFVFSFAAWWIPLDPTHFKSFPGQWPFTMGHGAKMCQGISWVWVPTTVGQKTAMPGSSARLEFRFRRSAAPVLLEAWAAWALARWWCTSEQWPNSSGWPDELHVSHYITAMNL